MGIPKKTKTIDGRIYKLQTAYTKEIHAKKLESRFLKLGIDTRIVKVDNRHFEVYRS